MVITMEVTREVVYVILVVELFLYAVKAKVKHINMCERNIMIRKNIILYHNISNLDLQLDEVTCQCDLYTPPYQGCVGLKALNLEILNILEPCKLSRDQPFNIYNSSCALQYKVNELYDNCTHNITVLIVPYHFLQEPIKKWLEISASDNSGVYVNCKWTGTLTTVTSDSLSTEEIIDSTFSSPTTDSSEHENSSVCVNCSRPSGGYKRHILPSEIADQIEIIIATACGFVLAFLLISFVCLCKSTWKERDKLLITPVRQEETAAQSSVTTEVQANATFFDSVFIETCSAEVNREGSGSYNELAEEDDIEEDDNKNKTDDPVFVNRNSGGCYDNVAFE